MQSVFRMNTFIKRTPKTGIIELNSLAELDYVPPPVLTSENFGRRGFRIERHCVSANVPLTEKFYTSHLIGIALGQLKNDFSMLGGRRVLNYRKGDSVLCPAGLVHTSYEPREMDLLLVYSRSGLIPRSLLRKISDSFFNNPAACCEDNLFMQTKTIEQAVAQYFEAWNESGLKNIKTSLERYWIAGGTYTDPNNPPMKGLDKLAAVIQGSQDKMPGRKLALTSKIDFHDNSGRYKWVLTKTDGKTSEGLDYFEYDSENRIVRLVSFFGVI